MVPSDFSININITCIFFLISILIFLFFLGKHDESSAYERQPYYDIYPLSKEMKEQLYRSLTPLSTAATCGGSESVASNDTYEPIENYDYVPVTLIHHDGDKLSTR